MFGLHVLLTLEVLLNKVSVNDMPPFISENLRVVLMEPSVPLYLDMSVGVRDVVRVGPVRAVLA